MTTGQKKIYVLDTNVILHDSSCIYQFEEHDVVVPIAVLEELDQFKKGNETLNFHAREFVRTLDSLSGDTIFEGGLTFGPEQSWIIIKLERNFHEDLALNFSSQKADHHILNTAYHLAQENLERQVILVSKDVNLRMKAKSIGLRAQDYKTDHVKDISALYTGHRFIEEVALEIINLLYQSPGEIDCSAVCPAQNLVPHEYLIVRNAKKSALAKYDPFLQKIKRIEKYPAYGIVPRNAGQTFTIDALMNKDIQLVSISGKAGTGKTLLALAAALENRKYYRQIFMARPIVPLSNRDIGYLPGDVQSKIDPYMQPLYDNLGVIQNQFSETDKQHRHIKDLLDSGKLIITPLAYIRGRSLVNVFFIVDEAQNLTPHEIKTIITRAGDGTKMVFTGDIFQIDHPYLNSHSNGLSYLIDRMQGQKLYAHINLEKGERSELAELASNLL
ncbi:PhoH family protein [candidate division CSSED10-310 bacterium]|uniref:PhoH family protein n=1 Tax=candidate division CSSED10-310 bacterium TaxID=2855610 RepID=A0ABV6YWP3_UNCC1